MSAKKLTRFKLKPASKKATPPNHKLQIPAVCALKK